MEKIKNILSGSLAQRIHNYLQKHNYEPVAIRVQDGSYVYLGHLRKEEAGTTILVSKDSLNKATLYLEFDDTLPEEEADQEYTAIVYSLEEVKKFV